MPTDAAVAVIAGIPADITATDAAVIIVMQTETVAAVTFAAPAARSLSAMRPIRSAY